MLLSIDLIVTPGKIVFLIKCKRCLKKYGGSIITWFKTRFEKYKSSLGRYGKVL